MNRLFTFFLWACMLWSCTEPPIVKSNKIIVAGKFPPGADTLAPALFVSSLIGSSQVIEPEINTNTFYLAFEAEGKIDPVIYLDTDYTLLLQPGDSLFLDIQSPELLTFHGEPSNRINSFIDFTLALDSLGFADVASEWVSSMEDDTVFVEKMDSLLGVADQFILSYQSSENSQWLNKAFEVKGREFYYRQLSYFWMSQKFDDIHFYRKKFGALDSEFALWFPNTYATFGNYFYYSQMQTHGMNNIPSDSVFLHGFINSTPNDSMMKAISIGQWVTSGLDMLDTIQYSLVRSFDVTLPEAFDWKIDRAYQEVKQTLGDSNKKRHGLIASEDYDMLQTYDSVLNVHKGKVIYVDVWATWCSPCIEEFEKQENFKAALQAKGVEFLYLCGRSDQQSALKAMIDKYQLEGTHFFMNKTQFDEFETRHYVQGFPTYLIYDQSGDLVEEGFYWRPSNGATLERIEGLLQEST